MAKINRFYLLIATLVMSKTYSAAAALVSGDVPSVLYSIQQYCAAPYNAASGDAPCAICVPYTSGHFSDNYTGLDDFLDGWYKNGITFNGTRLPSLSDMCAPVECAYRPSTYPVFMLGSRGDAVDGYYWECTSSGWKQTKESTGTDPTPTCNDKIVYNGTFKKCCNPTQSGTQWTCSSYSEKFCNSGYYGTFNGRSTDCTACPTSTHQLAAGSNGSWTASGKYASGISTAPNNTSISACFIAGSSTMIDSSGVYIFTGTCGY